MAIDCKTPVLAGRTRWFHISLRTFLVLVLAIGCGIGLIGRSARIQRDAVAAIERLSGGGVEYSWYRKDSSSWLNPWQRAWLGRTFGIDHFCGVASVSIGLGGSNAEMALLRRLSGVKEVQVPSSSVTDEGLKHLAAAIELESLDLYGARIDGHGLRYLKDLPNLRRVSISDTGMTAEGVVNLAGLTRAKQLDLSHIGDLDSALPFVGQLTQLEYLSLDGDDRFTNRGVANLESLVNLKWLFLRGEEITDTALVHLRELKKLEWLSLENTSVTGEGLIHLTDLTALKRLDLETTWATDDSLMYISGFKHLKHLQLHYWSQLRGLPAGLQNPSITDDTLAQLQGLEQLEWLDLLNASVTGDGLIHLAKLKRLKHLNLGGTSVSDNSLLHLEWLEKLEYLDLGGKPVTDLGLGHLRGLINLKYVGLAGTAVTRSAARELKQFLPHAKGSSLSSMP